MGGANTLKHIILNDLVVTAAGCNMMTRETNGQMVWVETWDTGEQIKTLSEDSS